MEKKIVYMNEFLWLRYSSTTFQTTSLANSTQYNSKQISNYYLNMCKGYHCTDLVILQIFGTCTKGLTKADYLEKSKVKM